MRRPSGTSAPVPSGRRSTATGAPWRPPSDGGPPDPSRSAAAAVGPAPPPRRARRRPRAVRSGATRSPPRSATTCSPPRRSTRWPASTSRAGPWTRPASRFYQALALGGTDPRLRGRIEQNLGILANIQGDHCRGAGPLPALAGGVRGRRRRQGPRHRLSQPRDGQRRPASCGTTPTAISARASSSRAASATCISQGLCLLNHCRGPPRPPALRAGARQRRGRARHLRPAGLPARQGRRLQGHRHGVPRNRPPRPGRVAAAGRRSSWR